jgi:hypothetical protein
MPSIRLLTLAALLPSWGCTVWSHTEGCDCSCSCDCTGPGCPEQACEDSGVPHDSATPWRRQRPGLEPLIRAFPSRGAVPLTVGVEAKGSEGAWTVARWDFDDGEPVTGPTAEHTYLAAGSYTLRLELQDRFGQRAWDQLEIQVDLASCPGQGQATELGTVAFEEIDEASGLVDSRANPGVLWVHNDSGDEAYLYALNYDGEHLGEWEIENARARDWEDLATGRDPQTGAWMLYIGDIGDNPGNRDSISVYRVPEPIVIADGGEQGGTLVAAHIELNYPDKASFNAETLLLDPATDDLYVVTKDYGGSTGVFRKPAPHHDGERATLEEIAWLDFSSDPLGGNATTGGAFSPLGDRFVIRTYATTAYLWIRDGADSVQEALEADPCTVTMPAERQAETIAFSARGDALLSISEGQAQPINRVPLLR